MSGLIWTTGSNGRASVGSVVRWANVVSRSSSEGSGTGSDFGVAKATVLASTASKEPSSTAAGVVVGGAGTKTLLFLVVACESELDQGGEEEEQSSSNSDGKADGVESAGSTQRHSVRVLLLTIGVVEALLSVRLAISERGANKATAAVCAVPSEDCNRDECSTEHEIDENGKKSEEGFSTKKAGEENGENSVQDCGARHALNCLRPCVDGEVAISERRQEVAVDAQYYTRTTEFDGIEDGLEQLECSTAESHCERYPR